MRHPEPLPEQLHGIGFSRREALALGVAEHRLRRSDLTSPVGRGIRVPAECSAPLLEAARALTARFPGVVISHRSAALLHRLRIPERWEIAPELWLTRTDNARSLRRPGVVCRRTRLTPQEVVRIDGVPVTSPVRTFLDVCGELSVTEAVIIADGLIDAHRWGIHRGTAPLCRPGEIGTALRGRQGRRGVRTARAAAERMRVGSDSPGETRLRLVLEDHGIQDLVLDHPLLGPDGTLLAQPDLALERHRLSLQYEGVHHDRAEQRVIDIRRLRATESVGWREIRICARDLHQHVTTTRGRVPMAVSLVWEAMGVAHSL
jgi:hypothetical protein